MSVGPSSEIPKPAARARGRDALAPPVFPGPAKPDPAALVELAMPSDARVPFAVGFVGQRLARRSGVLAIVFEPGAELGSKGLILGAVVKVHRASILSLASLPQRRRQSPAHPS